MKCDKCKIAFGLNRECEDLEEGKKQKLEDHTIINFYSIEECINSKLSTLFRTLDDLESLKQTDNIRKQINKCVNLITFFLSDENMQ